MRHPSSRPRAPLLRFGLALAGLTFGALSGVAAGCDFGPIYIWECLNPVTGKLPDAPYDPNHYVNGMLDPCHCFDPCGPSKACPEVVDAAPPPPGVMCDAGSDGS